jgi:hypothetical protein
MEHLHNELFVQNIQKNGKACPMQLEARLPTSVIFFLIFVI